MDFQKLLSVFKFHKYGQFKLSLNGKELCKDFSYFIKRQVCNIMSVYF